MALSPVDQSANSAGISGNSDQYSICAQFLSVKLPLSNALRVIFASHDVDIVASDIILRLFAWG